MLLLERQAQEVTAPRVLVVEDEVSIRLLVSEFLQDAGYEVETAMNGKEGIECLNQRRPDVVVLDLMMPIMDGRTFLQSCRSAETSDHLPVVVMSAALQGKDQVQDLGIEAFFTKPFDLDELLAAIGAAVPSERTIRGS
jgi:two-component system, OmpR family, alkaline phosphatase synthesis response regulator PhoP